MSRKPGHGHGRHTRQEFAGLLAEKDQQIQDLRKQLSIRVTNISNLETRLLSTLDALDAVQASSISELEQGHQTVVELRKRLSVCETMLQDMEDEKEDLKDAVLRLVERVETSNDYSQWPHGRIQVTGHWALAISTPPLSIASSSNGSNVYTASVVQELTRKLVQEQKAHARTVIEADARIAALEAQVARRDAELEHFIMSERNQSTSNQGLTFMQSSSMSVRRRGKQNEPPTLSREEAVDILTTAAARNRALEAEVHTLADMYQKATRASTSDACGNASPRHYTGSSSQYAHQAVQTEDVEDVQDEIYADESSWEKRPSGHATRPRPSISNSAETENETQSLISTLSTLDAVRHQVDRLGRKIDGLLDERDTMHLIIDQERNIQTHNPQDESTPEDEFQRISLVEEECIRLQASESALRIELENVRSSSRMRETELLTEITDLHEALDRAQNQDGTASILDEPDLTLDSTAETDDPFLSFPPLLPVPETYLMSLQSPPSLSGAALPSSSFGQMRDQTNE